MAELPICDYEHPRRALGYLIRRVAKLSTARVEAAFSDEDTTFTQWVVLALVNSGTSNTSSELARHTGHNSGAMTRLLDRLEERGMVEREPCTDDRRVMKLAVTPAGRDTLKEQAADVRAVWQDVLGDMPEEDVTRLLLLLTEVLSRFEAREGIAPGCEA